MSSCRTASPPGCVSVAAAGDALALGGEAGGETALAGTVGVGVASGGRRPDDGRGALDRRAAGVFKGR